MGSGEQAQNASENQSPSTALLLPLLGHTMHKSERCSLALSWFPAHLETLLEVIAKEIWRRKGESIALSLNRLSKNQPVPWQLIVFPPFRTASFAPGWWPSSHDPQKQESGACYQKLLENCSFRLGIWVRGQGKGEEQSSLLKNQAQDHKLPTPRGDHRSYVHFFSHSVTLQHWFWQSLCRNGNSATDLDFH